MTKKIWLAGDHHLGDSKILHYLDNFGRKLRPYFSLDEMHEALIENHNSVVKSVDKVIFVGDVVIRRSCMTLLSQLNGHKRLVRGNHDIFSTKDYLTYFKEIYGVKVIADRKVIVSHIPVHPSSLKEGWINIHGHLHCNNIDDPRYVNVSLEQINFTPIELDEIISKQKGLRSLI